jgi:alkanesulfonate monooxygenase SsuD/methylene tetrahydromethanopterin reductase-like flavin-dependent oxidoreductase (luciferase family)
MRLDVQPWGESLAELVDAARDYEAAGAGVAWAPELHRSAPVVAAALASGTDRIGIGTGIASRGTCRGDRCGCSGMANR